MTKKYCIFPFCGELDIVEIKLATLYDVVDFFVMAEATSTFSGIPRDITNLERLSPWMDKVRRIIVTDNEKLPPEESRSKLPSHMYGEQHVRWGRDIATRNMLKEGLWDAENWDVVILTDADEIPSAEFVKNAAPAKGVELNLIPRHAYYLNMRAPQVHIYEQVCRAFFAELAHSSSIEEIARMHPSSVVESGGWHFTYMGGKDAIKKKLASFAHGEYDQPPWNTDEHIQRTLDTGQDLFGRHGLDCFPCPIEELPPYVKQNQDKFTHLLKAMDD